MKLKCIYKHFITVCKHRHIVFIQCMKCGIPIQGILHDMSKFGITEFYPSAKYFQGNRSPIDAEKEETGYSLAWLHHKSHNKHHWEYWTDFNENGAVIANKIPYKYVVEMVCDWIGAGMVYSKDKWTKEEPLKYYYKVRNGRHFNTQTEELILSFLNTIKDKGLEGFYKQAKNKETKENYKKRG